MTMKNQQANNCWAIVPAAGIGSRMVTEQPKQYLKLGSASVIEHSLAVLFGVGFIKKICVVLAEQDDCWQSLNLTDNKLLLAHGGQTRAHSVLNGLLAYASEAKPSDWVLVHDAVRPCVKVGDIQRLMAAVEQHSVGGLLGIRATDTLKKVNAEQEVEATLSRAHIWYAQTPQLFRYELLLNALQKAINEDIKVTDEAGAIELLGHKPIMVEGRGSNIKITREEDLLLARMILQGEQG